jgi:pleiotropic regulator 1
LRTHTPAGWDLEYNKVIRHYHGHLSGVFAINVHPVLDVLVTGGRDSVARVWDMRTKHQIHVLGGHTNAVSSLITSGADPQVITGSHDSTIKLWDLAAGKCMSTLTQHKKAVRSLTANPRVRRPHRPFSSSMPSFNTCFVT